MADPPRTRQVFAGEELWNFYQRTIHDERVLAAEPEATVLVRELLLLLLGQGLNMDFAFNEGRHPTAHMIVGTPLGQFIHDRRDVEMIEVSCACEAGRLARCLLLQSCNNVATLLVLFP